jgi:hypothetical protein
MNEPHIADPAVLAMLELHDRRQRRLAFVDFWIVTPLLFIALLWAWVTLDYPWWFVLLIFLMMVGAVHVVVVTVARSMLRTATDELLAGHPPGSPGLGDAIAAVEAREDIALRGPLLWRLEFAIEEEREKQAAEAEGAAGDDTPADDE